MHWKIKRPSPPRDTSWDHKWNCSPAQSRTFALSVCCSSGTIPVMHSICSDVASGAGRNSQKLPKSGISACTVWKRTNLLIALAVFLSAALMAAEVPEHRVMPKDGFVPDAKTAIRIAVAVWEPIYGEDQIAKEKPYRVRLDKGGVWVVQGSLPKDWIGGVAIAEIAKDNGRILRVSHGK